MKIGIKYCGGCNPRYDRLEIAKRLKKDYPEELYVHATGEKDLDLVIVLCGCTAECADYQSIHSKYGAVVIHSEEQYSKITETINTLKK